MKYCGVRVVAASSPAWYPRERRSGPRVQPRALIYCAPNAFALFADIVPRRFMVRSISAVRNFDLFGRLQ